MQRRTKQLLWILIYFVLILAPLLILLFGPLPAEIPPWREITFWREMTSALGFVGLTLIGIQFAISARLPFVGEVFPMDTLYVFHHRLSIVGFAMALAHPLLLFINNPDTLQLLNVFTAPWRARAGVASVVLLLALVITSVKRGSLGLDYETWRLLHDIFAVGVIGFGLYHALKVNFYTSVPVQRGTILGLGALWGALIVYIRVIKPWTLLQRPYEVVDVIEERGNTWTLMIEPVGHDGLTFAAGEVAWLSVGHSPFRIEEHPFSFASSAEHPEQLAFAIKELGDFTSTIGDTAIGTRVYVDGPFGTFDLYGEAESDLIFIAGGIGSAPIMSMLRTLADRNDDRQIQFFYGNPTWDAVIFREELETLEERLNLEVIHVLERPPEDWKGESGFITQEILGRRLFCDEFSGCTFFVCGPIPMIASVQRALEEMGVSRGQLRSEIRQRIHTELYEMA
ncbi:MAG: ferric reductase-like transmembrane domain-containing protein [Anaerolineales bacterium]